MNYKLQDSTFDLLKNLSSDEYQVFSTKLNLNIIKEVKLRKINNFGIVLNSDFEADIKPLIQYLINQEINCYLFYFNKQHDVGLYKLDKLQFFKEYYTYTNQPFVEEHYKSNNVFLDVILCPILNFDYQKNFLDTSFNLINRILAKAKFKEFWGYCFDFQNYFEINNSDNEIKPDLIITNAKVYR